MINSNKSTLPVFSVTDFLAASNETIAKELEYQLRAKNYVVTRTDNTLVVSSSNELKCIEVYANVYNIDSSSEAILINSSKAYIYLDAGAYKIVPTKDLKDCIINYGTLTENNIRFYSNDFTLYNADDKFLTTEMLSRVDLLKAFPDNQFEFTTGKYDCYDASTIGVGGKKVLIEIKNRNIKHNQYPTSLFEMGKLEKMLQMKTSLDGEGIYYVANFNDGITLMWNLEEWLHLTPVTIKSKYQTMGDDRKVDKLFIELPTDKGTKVYRTK